MSSLRSPSAACRSSAILLSLAAVGLLRPAELVVRDEEWLHGLGEPRSLRVEHGGLLIDRKSEHDQLLAQWHVVKLTSCSCSGTW